MKDALAFFAAALVMTLILHANVPRPAPEPQTVQSRMSLAGQAPTSTERATPNPITEVERAQIAGSSNSDNSAPDAVAIDQPQPTAAEITHDMTRCNLLTWIETAGSENEP